MVVAVIGAKALYLLLLWLASAAGAAYLSERKGYGEKLGLASGLLLTVAGLAIWLVVPARAGSFWKEKGAIGRGSSTRRPTTSSGKGAHRNHR